MEYDIFYPYSEIFEPFLKELLEQKVLTYAEFEMISARVCGKTNVVLHLIVFIAQILLSQNRKLVVGVARSNVKRLADSMSELAMYFARCNPDFSYKQHFIASKDRIVYKNVEVYGEVLSMLNRQPKRGLRGTDADLIIIFVDERAEILKEQLTEFELSYRSDKQG